MKKIRVIGNKEYCYTTFFQRKKNGKKREINSPCHALKEKQYAIKEILESEIESVLPSYVVGFRKYYGLDVNCKKHLKRKWVINLDIKNFFPSITQEMLTKELMPYKNLIEKNGYLFDDFIEFAVLNRALPQGSPVSPLLSNYIGYKLIDKKVVPYLQKRFGKDFGYSRYADDLTVSLDCFSNREELKLLAEELIKLVESSGLFTINKKKIDIMHRSQKQVVTGVVVNQNPSLGKKEKLRYRAIMHKVKNKEIEMDDVLAGKLAFIKSIDPKFYEKLQRSLE